jgi:hypothetical protein
VATKEQIFEWIRYTCVTDTDAEQVAEIVATKLGEENGSSHNRQSTPSQCPNGCGDSLLIICQSCGYTIKVE